MTATPAAPHARERATVCEEAVHWLGTPFHHGARIRGVGVDCAQLLVACYADTGVVGPVDTGEYPTDWFLHDLSADRFAPFMESYCAPVSTPAAGDLALFRYGRGVSHAAICLGGAVVIHSFRELGVVYGSLEPTHDLFPRLAGFWTLQRWLQPPRGA